mgnify:CR=1 FL=1
MARHVHRLQPPGSRNACGFTRRVMPQPYTIPDCSGELTSSQFGDSTSRVTRARRLVGFFRQCLSYAFRSGSLHQSQAVRADKVSPCCFAKDVDLTSVPFDIFLVQRVHSRPARPNKKTSSMALIADRQKPVFIENASNYIKETDSRAILSKPRSKKCNLRAIYQKKKSP